jgi:beta-phosphoglucomutase
MPDEVRAILFDFDGVLVNSEDLHFRAFQRTGRDAGIELTEEEYYRDLIGFDDRGVWRQIAKTRGLALDGGTLLGLMAYKAQVARSLIHEKTYAALPGASELVRGLWRHYPLAIVTGALREEVELMLEGIALRDCFRLIIAAEDVANGKPDPEGYLQATAELARLTSTAIGPGNALIFEDAPRVIERAREAGFQTAGVPTHYGHGDLKADFEPKSLQPAEVARAVPGLRVFGEP